MSNPFSPGAFFAVSPNPYMVLNPQFEFIDMNEAYLRVTGRSREELLGRNLFDAFPGDPADPDDTSVAQLRDSLEQVLREAKPHQLALLRYAIQREVGSTRVHEERYWSATHVPLLDGGGAVAAILQHTVDVTELQAMKMASRATRDEATNGIEGGVFLRAKEVQQRHALLDEQNRHLRRLFDQAPGFIAVLRGPLHVFDLVNRAYQQLIGHRDLIGLRLVDAVPEIAGQGFVELLDRVLETAEPYVGRSVLVRLQREPGGAPEERYLDFIYQPIVATDGAVTGVLVQGHDVTEQERAREQSERYRERLERLLVERTEALTLSRAEHARRQAAEESLREETRILELLHRTGAAISSSLDLETLLQTVTDAATGITGARFGAFFYNTTDADGDSFLLYTLSGAPREAFERFGNPRATALFGPAFNGEGPIRSDDVLADPRYGLSAPHHGLPAGHPPVRSFLAAPVVSPTGEKIGGLFFGHPEPGVFSERSERLLVGIAGQAATAIDNARLYDEARRVAEAREKLMEAERAARAHLERIGLMKDEFLATLSHELRTPLTAILGWARVLQIKARGDPALEPGIEAIVRNAGAQARLIGDLLDMSRIVSGTVGLDVQPTDLVAVIDAAIESVRPSLEAREIRLQRFVDPGAGALSGDPHRLQQVVWNLLSNAVKFSAKGGTIDIVLERVAADVEITVRDHGVGIEPAFLPHVFERFRQADASTTRVHGGLGLGLAIVKQLVELHGGSIDARSDGPGTGATFVVRLPVAPAGGDPRDASLTTPSGLLTDDPVDLGGVTVLLVEDDPDSRELLRQVLHQAHAQVASAASADEALEMLAALRPDVLVSDIGMPGKDGYRFIREVRQRSDADGGRTPAIALTAFARTEDRTRAMMAGYQVHVAKPIEPVEFVATIASLAGRTGGSVG